MMKICLPKCEVRYKIDKSLQKTTILVLSNAFMCLVSLGSVSPLCFRKIDFSVLKFKHMFIYFFLGV